MTDTARTVPEWEAPETYELGSKVIWKGVRLTCTREHFAGDAAVHPWDPGHGWDEAKAATLWTPDGEVETARLRAGTEAVDPRLAKIIYYAAGGS